jgi:hypothetical protein
MLPVVSPAYAMTRSLQRAVAAINRDYPTLFVHDRNVPNPHYRKSGVNYVSKYVNDNPDQPEDEAMVWMPDVGTLRHLIWLCKPSKGTLAVSEALHVLGDLIHCDEFEKWMGVSWWAMNLSSAAFVACFILEVFGGDADDITLLAIDAILARCDPEKNKVLVETRIAIQKTARKYKDTKPQV